MFRDLLLLNLLVVFIIMLFLLIISLSLFGFIPYVLNLMSLLSFVNIKLWLKSFFSILLSVYSDGGGEYTALKDFLSTEV